jgi:hypothetical protein
MIESFESRQDQEHGGDPPALIQIKMSDFVRLVAAASVTIMRCRQPRSVRPGRRARGGR